jgi:hypothetical protein
VQRELPTGTVTFLFTDVEGSTQLLHELGAEAYAETLAAHRQVIRTMRMSTWPKAALAASITAAGGFRLREVGRNLLDRSQLLQLIEDGVGLGRRRIPGGNVVGRPRLSDDRRAEVEQAPCNRKADTSSAARARYECYSAFECDGRSEH